MKEEELVQARKLLTCCFKNIDGKNNHEEMLLEFSFDNMHQYLSKDPVNWSVQHMKMKCLF